MSSLIKIEDDTFSAKIEDDNNLKCGEIVFSNNTQFCFSCMFCRKVYEKIQEFFRHVLYDHLNYLDDYQFSDDDEFVMDKLVETKLPRQDVRDMEFIDVDESAIMQERINFSKHFEEFVDTPVKTEIEDVQEDEELDFRSDCDQDTARVMSSNSSAIKTNPQDILHIEILKEPSESDFEAENSSVADEEKISALNTSNSYEEDDQHSLERQNLNEAFSESDQEANVNANKDTTATKENVYNCPHCTKVFQSKISVNRHVSNVHQAKPDQHTCDKCPKTFKSESQLELHIKRHMGVKPHPCEICGACFSDKSNLNVHILRHKGIKPHKCSLCEKCFHSTTERKLHMRSHTGERPFVCEVCGRKFSNSGHLCSHRRRHLGEKRFQCDHCEKRFFDRKLLNDHKVMHTDERPFACGSCGASFQRKKALLQHEKLHSSVKQYVCKICGKSFAQNAGLYSHMKYH